MYKKFQKLLQEHKVTPYRVAKETGISPSTFTAWGAGTYTPKIDKIQKVADYFGVPITYFLEDNDE